MKIITLSDTHLHSGIPQDLALCLEGADLMIHAGDLVTLEVLDSMRELGPVEAVYGNSDRPEVRTILPKRRLLEVEGLRLGLVHQAAHSRDMVGPAMMAREMDVDVLVFGHLHQPVLEMSGDRLLVCPGSPTTPRQSPPTVAELEISGRRISCRFLQLGPPVCNYLKVAQTLSRGERIGDDSVGVIKEHDAWTGDPRP